MKIGIITHPILYNYGGILQNYALQQILKESGHEVSTIDRIPETPFKTKVLSLGKRSLQKLSGKKVRLRGWQTKKESKIIYRNTRAFVDQYINTTECITAHSQIHKIHKVHNFDAYIVGSDQVWRRSGTRGNKLEFLSFLEGNEKVKKIAYSASFGVSEWEYTEEETKKYRELAQLFDAISVREDSGVVLCNRYLDVKADHLVDPTMLLLEKEYTSLVDAADISKSRGDLFVYVLDRNEEKDKFIDRIAIEKDLKAFEVMPEQNFRMELTDRFDINKCVFPPVEQWLRAFMDAKFVVTDSFHGTAFALLFNKPFISILNKKRGASRFHSLLKMFQLENRVFSEGSPFDMNIVNEFIDFGRVDSILKEEKKKSDRFLKEALND